MSRPRSSLSSSSSEQENNEDIIWLHVDARRLRFSLHERNEYPEWRVDRWGEGEFVIRLHILRLNRSLGYIEVTLRDDEYVVHLESEDGDQASLDAGPYTDAWKAGFRTTDGRSLVELENVTERDRHHLRIRHHLQIILIEENTFGLTRQLDHVTDWNDPHFMQREEPMRCSPDQVVTFSLSLPLLPTVYSEEPNGTRA